MFADILLYILLILAVLNLILMTVYCRVMEKLDKRKRRNRSIVASTQNIEDEQNQNNKTLIAPFNLLKVFFRFMMDHFLYGLMRYSLLMTGKIPSGHVRNFLYRFVFNTKTSGKTVMYGGTEIRSPWNFHADNCVLSNNCILDCRNDIYIGQNVVFGGGVHIWTEEHDVNSPYFGVGEKNRGAVKIGDRAWICSDSTILPGVTVGEGAVLASRACATKDLEPYGIYAGIPAKKIGERNRNLVYELSGKTHWHFY